MALLNPPQIVPAVMRVILEATTASDFSDVDAIVDAIAPGDVGGERGGVVRDSFDALRTVALIETGGEKIVAVDRVHRSIDRRGSLRVGWPTLLLNSILEHPTAPQSILPHEDRTSGVRDLLLAVTWFLAQDAAGLPLAWNANEDVAAVQDLQVKQVGADQTLWPFSNDTRFRAMERWAVALGLGVTDKNGVRPIPLEAVRRVVENMDPGESTFDSFYSHLSGDLPFLWRGTFRDELHERSTGDPDPDARAGGIDTAVAVCLLALEREGRIKLKSLADAERIAIGPDSEKLRWVSHVEVTP